MANIVVAFRNAPSATTHYVYQYDYGVKLYITGVKNLPNSLEVSFTKNPIRGKAIVRVGTKEDNVLIVDVPDVLLENNGVSINYYVFALFYAENPAAKTGKTLYTVKIPVQSRQNPHTDKPVDEGAFAQAVKNIGELAAKADAAKKESEAWAHGGVADFPQCDGNNAKYWSDASKTYHDAVQSYTKTAEDAASRSARSASESSASADLADFNARAARQSASEAAGSAASAKNLQTAVANSAEAAATSEANASRYADQAKANADFAKKYVDEHYREIDINTDDSGINALLKDINGNLVMTKQLLGYDRLKQMIEDLNHPLEMLEFETHFDFPNVGQKNKLYLDKSTGDIFLYGVSGNAYTSVGVANDDVVYGGGA